jgi:transcriptional regulator
MLAATPTVLTDQERQVLSRWAGAGAEEHRLVERARVILLAEEGISTREIARRLHTRAARVSKWRQRFAKERLEGLSNAPTLCQVPLINAIKY